MTAILFVELLGGLGDVLIALPAIQALARSQALAQMTVLTFAPGGELLLPDPLIQRVVYAPKGEARSAVAQLLTEQSFDLVVSDTSYDGIDRLIQASATPRTITNLWRSPPAEQRVGDRFLQILLQEGLIQATAIQPAQPHYWPEDLDPARQALVGLARPLVLLIPDAGMAIKRWPLANFIQVGQELQQATDGRSSPE